MIAVKLQNVSVKFGKKFRHNQNYTMTFFDNVDINTTEDDIKSFINKDYKNKVILNKDSKIKIVLNTSNNTILIDKFLNK